jgi:hypothetical protein
MSREIPPNVLLYGSPEPLPERVPLRAGPLSLIYEAGDLKYIKLGEREIIRRIYAAVRDRNWGTVPGELSNIQIKSQTDSFKISYDSRHTSRDIDFVWRGEIEGSEDGTIRFDFRGEAQSTFLKNRLGFCVLHPMQECAGAPCRAEYASGETALVAFPKLVAGEQPVPGLVDLRGISHEVEDGIWAEVRFEGDLFETEDQRNWIDASFKTFCTPLRLPFPVEIKAGTCVSQSVMVGLSGPGRSQLESLTARLHTWSVPAAVSHPVVINLLPQVRPMLAIGLGISSDVSLENSRRVGALHLSHLRCDLRLGEANWNENLKVAIRHAVQAETSLEVALHLTPEPDHALEQFSQVWGDVRAAELQQPAVSPRLLRILVLSEGHDSTTEHSLLAARRWLNSLECAIGGGTDADFYQLNQSRPPAQLCDFLFWSINPQVHAFDNTSLVETPAAIATQIESARHYFAGKPLVVSPVTLKPRFNPVATSKEDPRRPDELPPEVDPRQMSLLGAAWTLAALKYLAESGTQSVTFYETTGWKGVMETMTGSSTSARFPSRPGAVFPLSHVLADAGEFSHGNVQLSRSSNPLLVESLCLKSGPKRALFLANLTPREQTVRVSGFGHEARLRSLSALNAHHATVSPEMFRAESSETLSENANNLECRLAPYSYARLDQQL